MKIPKKDVKHVLTGLDKKNLSVYQSVAASLIIRTEMQKLYVKRAKKEFVKTLSSVDWTQIAMNLMCDIFFIEGCIDGLSEETIKSRINKFIAKLEKL